MESRTIKAGASHLYPGLGKVYLQRQLLPGVDVRIVRLRKDPLQLLELGAGEGGPDAPLLPLFVQAGGVREKLVRDWEREVRVLERGDIFVNLRGPNGLSCGNIEILMTLD